MHVLRRITSSASRRILVTPTPGFVIKTTTTAPGFYTPAPAPEASSPPAPAPTRVPSLLKTFINVTFDPAIPAPPATRLEPAAEEQLLARTMQGALTGDGDDEVYFVPVVVSEGAEGKDKAGSVCIIFDAILHPSLKPRMLRNIDFKSFVLEIIISQIESPNTHLHSYPPTEPTPTRSLTLSRTLATPNIKYKGTLRAREVEVPGLEDMNGGGGTAAQGIGSNGGTDLRGMGVQAGQGGTAGTGPRRPLIEELPDKGTEQTPGDAETGEPRRQSGEGTGHELKSILKNRGEKPKDEVNEREKEASEKTDTDEMNRNGEAKAEMTQSEKEKPGTEDTLSKMDEKFEDPHVVTVEDTAREVPVWRWDGEDVAGRKMVIEVPKFTRPDHAQSTLSVSPDLMTLRTPVYFLQVGLKATEPEVKKARAEWRVQEGRLMVYL